LALVAEHVRLHGGRVRVDDRPDGRPGARFVVELPIVMIFDDLDDTESEWLDQVETAAPGLERDDRGGDIDVAEGVVDR